MPFNPITGLTKTLEKIKQIRGKKNESKFNLEDFKKLVGEANEKVQEARQEVAKHEQEQKDKQQREDDEEYLLMCKILKLLEYTVLTDVVLHCKIFLLDAEITKEDCRKIFTYGYNQCIPNAGNFEEKWISEIRKFIKDIKDGQHTDMVKTIILGIQGSNKYQESNAQMTKGLLIYTSDEYAEDSTDLFKIMITRLYDSYIQQLSNTITNINNLPKDDHNDCSDFLTSVTTVTQINTGYSYDQISQILINNIIYNTNINREIKITFTNLKESKEEEIINLIKKNCPKIDETFLEQSIKTEQTSNKFGKRRRSKSSKKKRRRRSKSSKKKRRRRSKRSKKKRRRSKKPKKSSLY